MSNTTKSEYGPTDIKSSALELIGNTPLVALDRIWKGPGRILAKCEFMNPGGSIKDRSAYSMIKYAKESNLLKDGAPIIEVTSGNQGGGIALVGAILEHPVILTMSAGNSLQRAEMMRGFGAECRLAPQVEGKPGFVTLADVNEALVDAENVIKKTPGIFYVDQFNNPNNCRAHEETTGPEIYKQTGKRVDAFVSTLGTGGSFVGISRYFKKQNRNIKCIVVEPAGSEPISGKEITKPLHLLQGSGYGKVPELFDHDVFDETMAVTDEEAVEYKKLLGTKEGLYVGFTSGANIAAAVRLLKSGKLGPDPWIVTVLNDTGLKYSAN